MWTGLSGMAEVLPSRPLVGYNKLGHGVFAPPLSRPSVGYDN